MKSQVEYIMRKIVEHLIKNVDTIQKNADTSHHPNCRAQSISMFLIPGMCSAQWSMVPLVREASHSQRVTELQVVERWYTGGQQILQ